VNIPRRNNLHPDQWVEQKMNTGKQRALEARDEIEAAVIKHPLRSLAIGFGVGYLSRSLPLGRIVGGSLRLVLPFVPHALLAIGAARAWEIARNERNSTSRPRPFMSPQEACVAACNKLLRGELSAIETYTQAVSTFGTDRDAGQLRHILAVHEDNASRLRQHIAEMGGEASFSSGLWGGFAKALEAGALAFGESPALAVLQAGEEQGVREYEEALLNAGVMEEIKNVIRQHMLPRSHENVNTLLRLKKEKAAL
jgi:demethoxyubiquinone hydroxylase (CLK1/Coq7/Cat5 family)